MNKKNSYFYKFVFLGLNIQISYLHEAKTVRQDKKHIIQNTKYKNAFIMQVYCYTELQAAIPSGMPLPFH